MEGAVRHPHTAPRSAVQHAEGDDWAHSGRLRSTAPCPFLRGLTRMARASAADAMKSAVSRGTLKTNKFKAARTEANVRNSRGRRDNTRTVVAREGKLTFARRSTAATSGKHSRSVTSVGAMCV